MESAGQLGFLDARISPDSVKAGDFSKIEAGRVELESVDFNMLDLLETTLDGVALVADEKELELVVDLAPEVRGWVRGDPFRLKQVVLNLLSNAVKFTARGAVTLAARLDATQLVLEVRDTGQGMSPEQVSRLFGGTGLGLSITKGLVELMSGTVSAQSVPGGGTQFCVRLPWQPASGAIEPAPAPPLHRLKARHRGPPRPSPGAAAPPATDRLRAIRPAAERCATSPAKRTA